MTALAALTTDATLIPAGAAAPGTDEVLHRLMRERSLLGSGIDEVIPTEPAVAVGQQSVTDTILAASASGLEIGGDLAPYGWRIAVGSGLAWYAARDQQRWLADAARLAFFGYTGPLTLTRFGPLTLASALFGPNGERVLADPGLVRDLPHLLAHAIRQDVTVLRERVPGPEVTITLDERGAQRILQGRIRTASGYRFHRPIGRDAMTAAWNTLHGELADTGVRLRMLTDASLDLLDAARSAGVHNLLIDPLAAPIGPIWERLAGIYEHTGALSLMLTPGREERQLTHTLRAWHELGFSRQQAQGFTLLLTRTPGRDRAAVLEESGLSEPELERAMRLMPAWAEKVST